MKRTDREKIFKFLPILIEKAKDKETITYNELWKECFGSEPTEKDRVNLHELLCIMGNDITETNNNIIENSDIENPKNPLLNCIVINAGKKGQPREGWNPKVPDKKDAQNCLESEQKRVFDYHELEPDGWDQILKGYLGEFKPFTISLQDNGYHSFDKGLYLFKESGKDKGSLSDRSFLLKESIMFLHHGIELLMKYMIVENVGEYLICEDINDDAIDKIMSKSNEEKKISIFDLDSPPHTTKYRQAIKRIKAFIDYPTLKDILEKGNPSLEQNLNRLNDIRNNIVHYAINIDIDEVDKLINQIEDHFMSLLEKGIKE